MLVVRARRTQFLRRARLSILLKFCVCVSDKKPPALFLLFRYLVDPGSSYIHARRLSDYIISYSVVLARFMANRACAYHEHDIISYFVVLLARVPNFGA